MHYRKFMSLGDGNTQTVLAAQTTAEKDHAAIKMGWSPKRKLY